ncbi:hypothetical protein AVEN_85989-1 [Araneus ventricosus]|uniref:Uncharacterized protein n=1 Tax=Araneus ventricosus TaxID=182803 RepID=A0A4Y2VCY5_ARAVE|nr:hypothetical protein AVEN_85989-1 [Araneus ventricosus]
MYGATNFQFQSSGDTFARAETSNRWLHGVYLLLSSRSHTCRHLSSMVCFRTWSSPEKGQKVLITIGSRRASAHHYDDVLESRIRYQSSGPSLNGLDCRFTEKSHVSLVILSNMNGTEYGAQANVA